jgi:hypothetical protein
MDEVEYSPSGGDNEEEGDEDKLENYDNDNDDDDKLDRRFHQAKAEAAAAVEALADPSPSTGHSTDIYGLWSFATVLPSSRELCSFSTRIVEWYETISQFPQAFRWNGHCGYSS